MDTERDEEEEPRKEAAKDYYAGYYFGNNPYTSSEDLPGRKSDEELKKDVITTSVVPQGTSLDITNGNSIEDIPETGAGNILEPIAPG